MTDEHDGSSFSYKLSLLIAGAAFGCLATSWLMRAEDGDPVINVGSDVIPGAAALVLLIVLLISKAMSFIRKLIIGVAVLALVACWAVLNTDVVEVLTHERGISFDW